MSATQYFPATPWSEHHVDTVAIDLGLRNLLATAEGDVLRVDFIDQLKRYDKQLLQLEKGLNNASIRRLRTARRYRVLVRRLQGYLKTTIQTHLAALLDKRRPQVVVIESLLFAGQPGTLSRRMNRLLRRFGQRYFTEALAQRQAESDFELVKVDPAYTSQQCNSCGFVHPGNRSASRFTCLACGHRAHADVNAAQNLRGRSAQKATSAPVARRTRWAQALDQWLTSRKSARVRAFPGSSRQYRVVGSARAGLTSLCAGRILAGRLPPSQIAQLRSCLDAATVDDLLEGLIGLDERPMATSLSII